MNNAVADPTRVLVFPCILSYPSLFEKKEWKDNDTEKKAYYQTDIWFLTSDPRYAENYQALFNAKNAAIAAKWGANPPHRMYEPIRSLQELKEPPEEQGFFIRAKTPTKPGVHRRDPNAPPGSEVYIPVTDPEDVYPGIIVAVSLTASPFDSEKLKGVSFWLNQVVLLRDGKRLGGVASKPPQEEFGGGVLSQYFGQLSTGDGRAAAAMTQMPGMMMPPQNVPPQYAPQVPATPPMPGYPAPPVQPVMPAQNMPPQYAPAAVPGYPPQQFVPQGFVPGAPGVPLPY